MQDDDLVKDYEKLIYKLSHYFTNYSSKEDLFQAGWIGLKKAIEKYDPSFDAKLSTYAVPFILGEMRKHIREDRQIKVSRDTTKLYLQVEKAKIILTQQLMREPSNNELCNFLKITPYEYSLAVNSINCVTSIDEVITGDSKDLTLHDVIESKSQDIDALIGLREAVNNLPQFEKKLIIERYYNDFTQSEVAKNMGISQVQVSRNEKKVLRKLRKEMSFDIAA